MAAECRKLDRKRPFAEIYGNHEARFEQFGIMFDNEENELPGYEDVEIPPEEKVIIISEGADSAELRRAVTELQQELSSLREKLADQEAATEEQQGRADTLEVENKRLTDEMAELRATTPSNPPKGGKADKAAPAGGNDLDKQLQLQGEA